MQALRIHNDDQGYRALVETVPVPRPREDEVLIRVTYSSVNYKDALAGTGRGKILKTFPLIGGVDAAGEVIESRHPRHRAGDQVLVTGWGMSFDHDGGYAEHLCVPGGWVVPLPVGLAARDAMILGTAGFTAALAVHRLLANGQHPDLGPLVVTGASGGVGAVAVSLLAHLGYRVTALSGKPHLADWLRGLGAAEVLPRDALPGGDRPLEAAVWGGAVDNVGGEVLARLTRTVRPYGSIASIGLAGGHMLHTTVMPFILRGVSLLGVDSVSIPAPLREALWGRLASDWRPPHLGQILTDTVELDGLPAVFERILEGVSHGRTLVAMSR